MKRTNRKNQNQQKLRTLHERMQKKAIDQMEEILRRQEKLNVLRPATENNSRSLASFRDNAEMWL